MLRRKFKEVILSVLPLSLLILVLHFTLTPLPNAVIWRFVIANLWIVLGLTFFLIGVDIGITPFGGLTGTSLAKSNRLWIVLVSGVFLGFLISIAEPGLMVLASQVSLVTGGVIGANVMLVVVSLGLAVTIGLGFLRIFFNLPLYKLLLILYLSIFVLSCFVAPEFLAIAFDASGSTTGIMAVPFILALSTGISKLKKDSKASEKDSFGLVAIASTGPILTVLLLDVFSKTKTFHADLELAQVDGQAIWSVFMRLMPTYAKETVIVIAPLLILLLLLQRKVFKLNPRTLRKLLTGFAFAFLGLFLFMVGINAGFMDVGMIVGQTLVLMENKIPIVVVGFIFGVLTILAEPAVYVLTHQIEQVTSGYIKRLAVLIPLALGVGGAVALSVVRVVIPEIQLWHYLLPGYILCILLMFWTPKLFIGIAFDAGGVATGPMTATLILAFIQGAAFTFEGADLLVDGFGMIAMVAMMPIITLQVLGYIFKLKTQKKERLGEGQSN